MLTRLKERGIRQLAGIDPSLDKTGSIDGIMFMRNFADQDLKLSHKYDLIFSNGVLEHIENMKDFFSFCRNNLKKDGKLFFSVPNARVQLQISDPGLFLHQHIQYFTENSASFLLKENGFGLTSLKLGEECIDVTAELKAPQGNLTPEQVFYADYQQKVDESLGCINDILRKGKVIVHGCNNALNNILGWLKKDFDFTLADNDNTKINNKYFGKTIQAVDDIDIDMHDTLLVFTPAFYKDIRSQYLNLGFKGKIECIVKTEFSDAKIS